MEESVYHEISSDQALPRKIPLILPLFSFDGEVELTQEQKYIFENQLISPPSYQAPDSDCACN